MEHLFPPRGLVSQKLPYVLLLGSQLEMRQEPDLHRTRGLASLENPALLEARRQAPRPLSASKSLQQDRGERPGAGPGLRASSRSKGGGESTHLPSPVYLYLFFVSDKAAQPWLPTWPSAQGSHRLLRAQVAMYSSRSSLIPCNLIFFPPASSCLCLSLPPATSGTAALPHTY